MSVKEKKIAWITGASSGIGEATATKLASEGWHVALTARSKAKLEELVQNPHFTAYEGDVTDAAAMQRIAEEIEAELGPIDMVVLCAGVYYEDSLKKFKAQTVREQYNVNVFGVMNALAPVLEKFRERGKGHIAIVSSVAGYRGLPMALSYASSKAALINFCESLAIECVGSDIKVQVVCPGFVDTPMTQGARFYQPMKMDVHEAAGKLVKGLKSSRFEIIFPWPFAMMLKVLGLLPHRPYIWLLSKVRM